jgi:hypothetical protein
VTRAAIDRGQLLELVWAAAAASLVVSCAFALMILGATRASDMRRANRDGAGTAYLALAAGAALLLAGSVVFGISVIVPKWRSPTRWA